MKAEGATSQRKTIGDAAVQGKTGRNWQQWFAILDAAGAKNMTHTEIAAYLREEQGPPGWWSQMVANTYEQERGLRDKHQMPTGYQISVSKTFTVPLVLLYQAWSDDQQRARWLTSEVLTVRKAAPNKSMRITWTDAQTSVEVLFYDQGESRSQVVVQHSKLADSAQAEEMKGAIRYLTHHHICAILYLTQIGSSTDGNTKPQLPNSHQMVGR